jgi:hypothetical protein
VSCSVLYSTLHPLHLLAKSLPVIVIAGWIGDAVIDHIFDHLLVSDELRAAEPPVGLHAGQDQLVPGQDRRGAIPAALQGQLVRNCHLNGQVQVDLVGEIIAHALLAEDADEALVLTRTQPADRVNSYYFDFFVVYAEFGGELEVVFVVHSGGYKMGSRRVRDFCKSTYSGLGKVK